MTGKFRAYDKEKKCYHTTYMILISRDGKVWMMGKKGVLADVTDRYEIEWETPAKDKDGKPIYQGDRLQADVKHGGGIEWVEWSGDEMAWVCENGLDHGSWLSGCEGVVTIIGTIHDEGGE